MQIKPMKIAVGALLALFLAGGRPASAGFKSPESLIRNVYAHYGSHCRRDELAVLVASG